MSVRIADVSLALRSFLSWKLSADFLPFLEAVPEPDFQVNFCLTDVLPQLPNEIVCEAECYRIHPDGKGGFLRSFFQPHRSAAPYAVTQYDLEHGRIHISCLPADVHCVSDIHNSFFHIDIESLLITRDRIFLHAACVDTYLGGILFSGPSGIGKSTQADLWCSFRGAKQINGDRPILSRDGDRWLAWGSPYAGSSRCHVNESSPIRAIVMLAQGDACRIRRLDPAQAFRSVWAGVTVHSWDKDFMERAVDLTLALSSAVPVYHFTCTPNESAVQCLEAQLRKDLAYGIESNQPLPTDGISVQ